MFKLCEQNESTFTASFTQTALTMALVLATAGMIFFTTPNVSMYVTPSMPNFSPRSRARSYTHFMSPGESASSLRSGNSRGHCKTYAYAMQCSGMRGVSAMVHSGTAAEGAKASRLHSKQEVIRGRIRRDCPEKPSVPPSMRGMMVSGRGSPSSSNSTRLLIIPFSHLSGAGKRRNRLSEYHGR